MDWKYLFTSLEGRIGRQSYWMGVIAITVITIVAALIDVMIGRMSENGYGPVSTIAVLALIYPSIVLYAKRWHDRDKSGWWTLISFVPIIGGLWMLIECGFLKGTDGPNRFGPDPLR
jgi:uncharacterized membrane protein YhaH (DUF805 family)